MDREGHETPKKVDKNKERVNQVRNMINDALFPNQISEGSPFADGAYPDRLIKPGTEAEDKEKELRAKVDQMFDLIEVLVSGKQREAFAPIYYVDQRKGRPNDRNFTGYTTWTRTALEIDNRRASQHDSGKRQIYLTEEASVETGDKDEDALGRRKMIESSIEGLRNEMDIMARRPGFVSKYGTRDEIVEKIAMLNRLPFSKTTVTFQEFRGVDNITPHVGFRVEESLLGVQVFPVVYIGKEPQIMRNQMALDSSLNIGAGHYYQPASEYAKSPVSFVVDRLFKTAEEGYSKKPRR